MIGNKTVNGGGRVMTKWLVGLLLGMYLVFQLGGDDPMKLRPGLVNAGVDPSDFPKPVVEPVETRTLAAVDDVVVPKLSSSSSEPLVAAQKVVAPRRDVVAVAYSPDVAPVQPARQPEKVFTLSVLPGQENAPAVTEAAPETAAATPEPQVWYVTGKSLNVRLDPSTDAPIVGKLSRGDAALVVADNGAGWALVTVEGDGVSGYVSMDFLSPEAP
jgi:Bacterial SH3 domain